MPTNRVNLEKLREKDLKRASFSDIVMIVEALEKESLDKYNSKSSIEIIDTYLSYVEIIKTRVEQGEFDKNDLKSSGKRIFFIQRLNTLRTKLINLKQFSHFVISKIEILEQEVDKTKNELKQDVENARQIILEVRTNSKQASEQINDLQTTLLTTQKTLKDISSQSEELKSIHDKLKEKLETTEHDIITHVLTLLGVFSAIIITIMSVVITTNSWLNNAGKEGFMLALLVPNLIVIFSIVVLVSMVYAYHGMNYLDDKKRRGPVIFFLAFISIIIVALGVMLGITIQKQNKVCEVAHIRYVISQSEYVITTETVPGIEDTKLYYKFNFDGQNLVFDYNKNLVHDGNLYFCPEHGTLE